MQGHPIMLTDIIRLLLFPALMAFAASSDLLTMTISNRLSLALAASFFLLTLVIGLSLPAVGMHLAAAALVLAFAFGFFSQGWIGGGDAKLAAATALWFGFENLLDYLIYASPASRGFSGCTSPAAVFRTVLRSRPRRSRSIQKLSGCRQSAFEAVRAQENINSI
jgi:prepilin signal peptidase PulO-like enzyme (type II secretory pathway)